MKKGNEIKSGKKETWKSREKEKKRFLTETTRNKELRNTTQTLGVLWKDYKCDLRTMKSCPYVPPESSTLDHTAPDQGSPHQALDEGRHCGSYLFPRVVVPNDTTETGSGCKTRSTKRVGTQV